MLSLAMVPWAAMAAAAIELPMELLLLAHLDMAGEAAMPVVDPTAIAWAAEVPCCDIVPRPRSGDTAARFMSCIPASRGGSL